MGGHDNVCLQSFSGIDAPFFKTVKRFCFPPRRAKGALEKGPSIGPTRPSSKAAQRGFRICVPLLLCQRTGASSDPRLGEGGSRFGKSSPAFPRFHRGAHPRDPAIRFSAMIIYRIALEALQNCLPSRGRHGRSRPRSHTASASCGCATPRASSTDRLTTRDVERTRSGQQRWS